MGGEPVTSRPLLLGHRGARRYAPENTFEAFDLALEHGCHGFEFDVRCTADRRAVICHDPKLGRLEVASATYERLSGGRPVPCLEDILARYAQRAFLDIELKTAGLEDALLAGLRQHPPGRGYLVSSFLPEVLLAVRGRAPEVPLGFICDKAAHLARWRELPVEYVVPQFRLLNSDLVRELQSAGRKVFAWTVNREGDMRRLAEWGVDGIISDDSRLLGRLRDRG